MKEVKIKISDKKLKYKNALDPKRKSKNWDNAFRKKNFIIYPLYGSFIDNEGEEWRDA